MRYLKRREAFVSTILNMQDTLHIFANITNELVATRLRNIQTFERQSLNTSWMINLQNCSLEGLKGATEIFHTYQVERSANSSKVRMKEELKQRETKYIEEGVKEG